MSEQLLDLARHSLEALSKSSFMEKESFEPMPGGQPVADPAMAQGGGMPVGSTAGMPMDPAMAGMPVDPSAAGVGPAVGSPPPAAAPVPPAAPSSGGDPMYDMIVNAVRQVIQEMGVGGGSDNGGGSKGGKDVEARLSAIEGALAQVLEQLGMANPEQALAQSVEESAGAAPAAGMGMAAGVPSSGEGAVPMPAGPMDPNAGAAMGGIALPNLKLSSAYERPLDADAGATAIARGIKALRARGK